MGAQNRCTYHPVSQHVTCPVKFNCFTWQLQNHTRSFHSVFWWLILWFLLSANVFLALDVVKTSQFKRTCLLFLIFLCLLFYLLSILGFFHLAGSYTSTTSCEAAEVSLNRRSRRFHFPTFQWIVLNWRSDESGSDHSSYIIPLQLISVFLVHLHLSSLIWICFAKTVDLYVSIFNSFPTVCFWN